MAPFSTWALVVPVLLSAGLVYTFLTVARLEPQKAQPRRQFPR